VPSQQLLLLLAAAAMLWGWPPVRPTQLLQLSRARQRAKGDPGQVATAATRSRHSIVLVPDHTWLGSEQTTTADDGMLNASPT
jgi:hypothetical protein